MTDPADPLLRDEELDDPSPIARTMLTVLVTVLVAGLLVGGLAVASVLSKKTTTQVSRVDLADAAQLSVQAGKADVRFVEGRSDTLVVRARVTSGIRKTAYTLQRKGSDFVVDSSCQTWLAPGCGVQVTFEVPPGVPLVVATDAGDVRLDGLEGRVVTVATRSGDVEADRLAVTELSATTSSGDVDASFTKQPFALKITTGDGDVDAEVPSGDVGYAVDVRSSSGDVENGLTDDPGGQGIVRVRTGAGDVELGS
ncbi:hypothetical protein ASD11_03210 [Aeromicrobium sp. Root495]|uniref:DUF4097 family beta strand repeat-containing protein n=1 Tax=Aeromicrobium sp. Root495 TaxID=1736550 RepID=UPI0006FA99D4|nr:DUF4097 family beta strand repeat-containing protein [Aeromicrobium sp. Root495]KQY58676.1 hypothetical protein ASD11_03210 [Aeromicrobium sp. Root495]